MTTSSSSAGVNPFVGPRPLETGQRIFGRDREIEELYYLLSAERIVLLHSPSGAGKSSLIRAGLVPRLAERFDVRGPTRLNTQPPKGTPNRYVGSANLGFEQGLPDLPEDRRRADDLISSMKLAEYIEGRPRRRSAPQNVVLIFDQFEEILTADPLAFDAKREFFRQLGELLQDPRIWVLFALREDYLAPLDPYADQIPTHLKNRFRVDLLSREASQAAMVGTAAEGGRAFAQDAVKKLVMDLATMKVQQPDGNFKSQEGPHVEPLHLQVACRGLWERMPPTDLLIDLEHIKSFGDVTRALATYYETEVAALANHYKEQPGALPGLERSLRTWVDEKLIIKDGIRSQVLKNPDQSEGLRNELIEGLVNSHLVRAEQRSGATWYELAHDRLIEPVRKSNAEWFKNNLQLLQRQAALWERENEPDRLLLRDRDLKEAESWARDNAASVLRIEKKLLDGSAKKRRAARTKVGMIALVICILLIGLVVVNLLRVQTQEHTRVRAEYFAITSSQLLNASDLTQALRVAQAAYDVDPEHLERALVEQVLTDGYRHASIDHEALAKAILRSKRPVTSVAYSPEDSTLVTTSEDGTATLWNKNGERIREMKYEKDGVPDQHAAFFHHGGGFVTTGRGGVQIWDRNGNPVAHLDGRAMAISPDDATIVTVVSPVRGIILWGRDGKPRKVLDYQGPSDGWIPHVAFSPDGKYFATSGADWDGTVQLYNADGQHIASLGHDLAVDTYACSESNHWDCRVSEVAFSPTDKSLWLAAFPDRIVRQYDVGGNLRRIYTGHTGRINSVIFSPDGQSFLSSSDDHTAILWNNDGSVKHVFRGHTDAVTTAIFSPDGKYIVTGSRDNTAKLWDLDGNILATYAGHKAAINTAQFSPDMKYVVTASDDKTAILWGVRPPAVLNHDGGVVSARFLPPDGKRILTASNDMSVRLWSAEDTSTPLKTYEKIFGPDACGNKRIYSLDISPDGKRFITTGTDYTVRIWEVETGRVLKYWVDRDNCTTGHWCGATNARYSFDGNYIVTSDFGGVVKIFDREGKFLRTIPSEDKQEIDGIAISPDNKYLVTGSNDKTIKLWDFETGRLQHTFSGHNGAVKWVDFSAKGDRIVSGSDDQTVKVWDLQGNCVLDIEDAHCGEVRSVEFSPDTKQILSASADKTAKIWDMNGQLVRELDGHKGELYSAFFSRKGDEVITASGDKTAVIWPNAERICKWLRYADMYQLTPEDWKKLGIQDYPQP